MPNCQLAKQKPNRNLSRLSSNARVWPAKLEPYKVIDYGFSLHKYAHGNTSSTCKCPFTLTFLLLSLIRPAGLRGHAGLRSLAWLSAGLKVHHSQHTPPPARSCVAKFPNSTCHHLSHATCSNGAAPPISATPGVTGHSQTGRGMAGTFCYDTG